MRPGGVEEVHVTAKLIAFSAYLMRANERWSRCFLLWGWRDLILLSL